MKMLLLLAVLILAGLSFAGVTAENTVVALDGSNWATRFCSSAHVLCRYPLQLGYSAAACGVLWLTTLLLG